MCLKKLESDPHHITSVGAGGDDTPENLMPLCFEHHSEIHAIGTGAMCIKYPVVETWLKIADRWDVLERIKRK